MAGRGGPTLIKRARGDRPVAIKEAAKRCTNDGWPVGPTLIKGPTMSRIGKKPVPIPDKVKVDIKPNAVVVTGPKGSVTNPIPPGIKWEQKDKQLVAIRPGDTGAEKAFHGLARA